MSENKTKYKYSRLRLTDELSRERPKERPETDLRKKDEELSALAVL